MITIPLIKKIAELFLILFATAALVKTGVFKADYSRVLSRISLYFVTPCVIFNSFQKELTPDVQQGLLITAGLAVAFQLVFFLVAAVLRRVWKATEVERASIVFTNAGNLIIPLVAYVLGQEWVIYVSSYILVFNVMFWTIGIRMFDHESAFSLKKVLLNPNILAVLFGLLLLFAGVSLPEPAAVAFSDVAGMIGPLSMMITGMVVGSMKLRDMFANRRIFGVLILPDDPLLRAGRAAGRGQRPGRQQLLRKGHRHHSAAFRDRPFRVQYQSGGHPLQPGREVCLGDQRADHPVLHCDHSDVDVAVRSALSSAWPAVFLRIRRLRKRF